jgi:hypothetical protein
MTRDVEATSEEHTMKIALLLSLVCIGSAGCAAQKTAPPEQPATPAPSADDTSALRDRIAQLESQIESLNNHIGHLQSDLEAASPDNELTTMTIDGVKWGTQAFGDDHLLGSAHGKERMLLLHPVEWRGYGKMKRFIGKSDQVFYLEAEGKPRIEADAVVGGICNADGSTRYVMVRPSAPLEHGVTYHLHARNENETYKWTTPDTLVVSPSTSTR